MASQQATKEAATRESRANARETMAVLTSGARQKVDTALADASALGQQMLHPFDKDKRAQAQEAAEEKKKEAVEKRDGIRAVAQQQAMQERLAARGVKPESGGGQIEAYFPSTQTAGHQEGVHAPVEELDRAEAPTSEHQRTTLGEMLGREVREENPHIEHVEGNDLYNPHLDRNLEFRCNSKNAPTGLDDTKGSAETNRDISNSDEERPTSERDNQVYNSSEAGQNIASKREERSLSERE